MTANCAKFLGYAEKLYTCYNDDCGVNFDER